MIELNSALFAIAALAFLGNRNSKPATGEKPDDQVDDSSAITPIDPFFSVDSVNYSAIDAWDASGQNTPALDIQFPSAAADPATIDASIAAFLYMIRRCEHSKADVDSGRCYNVVSGGSTFENMSGHPYITGEWAGRKLNPATCVNAGISPPCISTAAGAYQITAPTWLNFASKTEDFTPQSQDAVASRMLARLGAIDRLGQGDLQGAIAIASTRWAALPGSKARQGPKSVAFAMARYAEALTA